MQIWFNQSRLCKSILSKSKKKEEKEGENKQNLNPACFKLTVPGSPSSSSKSVFDNQ